MKLGRNEQCWCGSGLKYKRCHLHREREEPPKQWEVAEEFRKSFSAKLCSTPATMHSECTGHIVRAHTVPRAGSLTRIARDGHVYALVPTLENIARGNGLLEPQLVGVNRASTFTGFCSRHDDGLFAPLEKVPFIGSAEQCFLLAYRSYAREIFTKTAANQSARLHKSLDKGRSPRAQMRIQLTSMAYDIGLGAAMRDIAHHRPRFEQVLVTRDFSSVRAYTLTFGQPSPVMCSATFGPEQDFDGNELQDLSDPMLIPHLLSVSSFASGEEGKVVFVWLEEDDPVCIPFIGSLHRVPDTGLGDAVVRLMFEFFENIHIAPEWWESASPEHRVALVRRIATSAHPEMPRRPGCLRPDGFTTSGWHLKSRHCLGFKLTAP